MNDAANTRTYPVVEYFCQVKKLNALTATTFEIELEAPEGAELEYAAGQHLALELDVNGDGTPQSLSYTIANNIDSSRPRRLQLFIQNGSEFANKILKTLSSLYENNERVKVTLAMGNAYLKTDLALPHLLIAAGSGIAKVKSITEEIIKQQPDANVHIYWSNRQANEFYLLDTFEHWSNQYRNLSFTPVLEVADPDWPVRFGYLYQVIQEDFDKLNDVQAYLCGSPQMVYGTIDRLEPKGLKETNCYSDVFEYMPRDKFTSAKG
ncbi:MAG: NAD(P)H-flavin reductase [Methylophaga sp.]|uniref:NAD(P)H-flavin reductase n=1 Tax=Methylophaga sp. UBA678 TaxID=1946901 RepID=UPI000C3A7032|nr:NAD(P)H-flavin reductase [Methylophaga sp. UBA678]MAX51002.1 NAD(P)H-flavin reductase [Methylophaga sp.]|tara:strand:- start:6199 stop:6993 length:795 start_codon:yes stop_codon:yes gene_type:complete